MNWKWITGDVGSDILHGHACPEHLVEPMLGELRERYPRLNVETKDADYLFLDMPGMVCLDRPTTTWDLGGLRLEMPCEDIAPIYRQFARVEMRTWGGSSFGKLHGYYRCLVFDGPLRDILGAGFEVDIEDCERRAEEFYRTRMTPNQALHAAQGLSQDVDLGPDRLARFVPKPKGEA